MRPARPSAPPQAPPIVAPPVVGRLPGDQTHRSPQPTDCDGSSTWRLLSHRILRDVVLGGACLIVGLIVGQGTGLDHFRPPQVTPRVGNVLPTQSLALPSRFEPEGLPSESSWGATGDPPPADGDEADRSDRLRSDPKPPPPPPQRLAQDAEPTGMTPGPGATESNGTSDTREVSVTGPDQSHVAVMHADTTQATRGFGDPPPSMELLTTFDLTPPPAPPQCQDGTCQQNMESHGTGLRWADTPADAYRIAKERGKLVFLIHVSGNFEIPGFT